MCDSQILACVAGGETSTPTMVEIDQETYEVVKQTANFMLQSTYEISQQWQPRSERSGPSVLNENFVMFSDRPLRVVLEQSDAVWARLHNEDGPACEYRDGWKLWYIHGVPLDEVAVMRPEMQSSHQMDLAPSLEARKIRRQRYLEAKRKLNDELPVYLL